VVVLADRRVTVVQDVVFHSTA